MKKLLIISTSLRGVSNSYLLAEAFLAVITIDYHKP